MRVLAALPVLLLLFAGCSQPAATITPADTIETITNPLQNRTNPGSTPHLHDYWGGAHSIVVEKATIDAPSYLWIGNGANSVAAFRPSAQHVVPQGAGWVNITVGWTENTQTVPPNSYQNPQLFVKTASDNELVLRANLTENPSTIAMQINASAADLPHQVLSAWQFDLFVASVPAADVSETATARFSGTVDFTVTADRTLPIAVFPGHPDQWNGQPEIKLFSGGGTLIYDGDPTTTNWRCYGGCPVIHHPDDGIVVPIDTSIITVKLGLTTPMKMGIKYHGADAREFIVADISEDSDTMRIYRIPTPGNGDGAYAKQSQWEIVPYLETPEDGFVYQDYTIEAIAQK